MIDHIHRDPRNHWVTVYKGNSESPILQIRVENETPEIIGWFFRQPFTVHFKTVEEAVDAAIDFVTETSWFFVLESCSGGWEDEDSEEWENVPW